MRHTIMMLGMTMAMAASACGSESGGDQLTRFVGTWRPVSGTTTTSCPGYTPETRSVATNLIWSTGVGADLVSADGECVLMADVTNATAAGVPGQSCTIPDGQGGTYTLAYGGYTFVISPDGRTATENGSGQVTFVGGGATLICTFTGSASYEKIGN